MYNPMENYLSQEEGDGEEDKIFSFK